MPPPPTITSATPSGTPEARRSAHLERTAVRPLLMSIRDSAHEYMIDVDERGIGGDALWVSYDDGFLTIGCEAPEAHENGTRGEPSNASRRCRTFLLVEGVESAAIRTESVGGALVVRVPKSEPARRATIRGRAPLA